MSCGNSRHPAVHVALLIYLIGVAIGLLKTDASWPAKAVLSLLWPIGPLAFVAVIAGLVVVAALAFPLVGAVLLAAVLAGMYLWLG
jgi:hypothetical protein